jgi:hypothetical protein
VTVLIADLFAQIIIKESTSDCSMASVFDFGAEKSMTGI